jgi:hypothetical protein
MRMPIGGAMGAPMAQPEPASRRTAGMGTEGHRGVQGPRAAVSRGHRSGPHRRRGGRCGLVRTQGTGGLVRQARKRLGRLGALAPWRGGVRLRSLVTAWAGPSRAQHNQHPQASTDRQLRRQERRNHGMAPSPCDDLGTFYSVFGAGNYPQDQGTRPGTGASGNGQSLHRTTVSQTWFHAHAHRTRCIRLQMYVRGCMSVHKQHT